MDILGIRVDEVSMEEALAKVASFVADGKQTVKQIVTINPEGIWLARQDEHLRQIVVESAMVTPDGTGVLWAAERYGTPLRERVTGIDLMQELCAKAACEGWRIYLLGAKPGVAEAAAAELLARYPGLQIAGMHDGYFKGQEAAVVAEIAATEADLLFAALGMPFQEHFLYEHKDSLGCAVAVGVGGSLDVLAGNVKRAPRLMQKLRLEWLWRLLLDPKRWRRYLVIPRFMSAVKKDAKDAR